MKFPLESATLLRSTIDLANPTLPKITYQYYERTGSVEGHSFTYVVIFRVVWFCSRLDRRHSQHTYSAMIVIVGQDIEPQKTNR